MYGEEEGKKEEEKKVEKGEFVESPNKLLT